MITSIICSKEEVRAILAGEKTQFRKLLTVPWYKSQRALPYEPYWVEDDGRLLFCDEYGDYYPVEQTAPYQPGKRLWVRETWGAADQYYQGHDLDVPRTVAYKADLSAINFGDPKKPRIVPSWDIMQWNWDMMKWKSATHLPQWASRITLEVTSVRAERLQDITREDAIAEGCFIDEEEHGPCDDEAEEVFQDMWEAKYRDSDTPWAANPWVWVVGFRVVQVKTRRGLDAVSVPVLLV